MTKIELNEKVMDLKKWEKELKAVQTIVDSLKDELKAELISRGEDEVETDMFTISYKEVVSNRFDTATFKKENEILYNHYLKESVSKRFLAQ